MICLHDLLLHLEKLVNRLYEVADSVFSMTPLIGYTVSIEELDKSTLESPQFLVDFVNEIFYFFVVILPDVTSAQHMVVILPLKHCFVEFNA
jgi:hypothetical protein